MKNLIASLIASTVLALGLGACGMGTGGSGPRCTTGCRCGNSCISCSKNCTKAQEEMGAKPGAPQAKVCGAE